MLMLRTYHLNMALIARPTQFARIHFVLRNRKSHAMRTKCP